MSLPRASTSLNAAAACLCAALATCACGGRVLRTMEKEAALPDGPHRLSAVMHHGSVAVLGDAALTSTIRATSVVRSRGLVGALSGTTDPESLALEIGTTEDAIRVTTGSTLETDDLDFELTVRVPKDHLFQAVNSEQNHVETSGGTVTVRDFGGNTSYIWSTSAIDGERHAMEIENVTGSIQSNSGGDLTIRGCPNVVLAQADGDLDMEVTAHPTWQMPKLGATDDLVLRVRRGLDISFLHEKDLESVVRVDSDHLKTRVHDDGISAWFEVYAGAGTRPGDNPLRDVAYQVYTSGGSIEYRAAD